MRSQTVPFCLIDVAHSQHLCLECGHDPIDFNSPICAFCRIQRECKEILSDLSQALSLSPAEARQLAELTDLTLAGTTDPHRQAVA